MRIILSGASGLAGMALRRRLEERGDEVWRLARRGPAGLREILWNPAAGEAQEDRLEGAEAVIHLAGENLGAGRWTAARKKEIWDSRIVGTEFLSRTLLKLKAPPRALLCASAVGWYGHRGAEALTEESGPGRGFLAELCQAWEAACVPAAEGGIRVVHLRFAMILSRDGGAIPRMLTPFRLGLGGRMGSGEQYWSWVALSDLIRAVEFLLERQDASGPFNIAAPQPVTNQEFTAALAGALRRPAFFAMPRHAARLAFGEMAEAMLLPSARVIPARLSSLGFQFQHPILGGALRVLLGG